MKVDEHDHPHSEDIELKDFIKIFRNDEVGDNIIKAINNEVIFRKKLAYKKQVMEQINSSKLQANLWSTNPNCCGTNLQRPTDNMLTLDNSFDGTIHNHETESIEQYTIKSYEPA